MWHHDYTTREFFQKILPEALYDSERLDFIRRKEKQG